MNVYLWIAVEVAALASGWLLYRWWHKRRTISGTGPRLLACDIRRCKGGAEYEVCRVGLFGQHPKHLWLCTVHFNYFRQKGLVRHGYDPR